MTWNRVAVLVAAVALAAAWLAGPVATTDDVYPDDCPSAARSLTGVAWEGIRVPDRPVSQRAATDPDHRAHLPRSWEHRSMLSDAAVARAAGDIDEGAWQAIVASSSPPVESAGGERTDNWADLGSCRAAAAEKAVPSVAVLAAFAVGVSAAGRGRVVGVAVPVAAFALVALWPGGNAAALLRSPTEPPPSVEEPPVAFHEERLATLRRLTPASGELAPEVDDGSYGRPSVRYTDDLAYIAALVRAGLADEADWHAAHGDAVADLERAAERHDAELEAWLDARGFESVDEARQPANEAQEVWRDALDDHDRRQQAWERLHAAAVAAAAVAAGVVLGRREAAASEDVHTVGVARRAWYAASRGVRRPAVRIALMVVGGSVAGVVLWVVTAPA